MNREQFEKLLDQYGDAQVFIRGPKSHKIKYNVVTADLDNPHIQKRSGGRTPTAMDGRVLTFAWDQDDFRQIDPTTVVKVVPLSEVIQPRRPRGRG